MTQIITSFTSLLDPKPYTLKLLAIIPVLDDSIAPNVSSTAKNFKICFILGQFRCATMTESSRCTALYVVDSVEEQAENGQNKANFLWPNY